MMRPDELTTALAGVVRAEEESIRALTGVDEPWDLVESMEYHGVLYLTDQALRQTGTYERIDAGLREAILVKVRCEQSVEMARHAELGRVVSAFGRAGVRMLLFKGAALAYTHYPHPRLRPRNDTDVLIHPDDRARAFEILQDCGYAASTMVDREAIFTQRSFYRRGVGSILHAIDLHWRVTNRALFRRVLSFDELWTDSVEVPTIAGGRAFSGVHALLLACMHPVAHHHCEWPLVWLFDLALIGGGLSSSEWARFRQLATERRISSVCRHALIEAARRFPVDRAQIDDIPEGRAAGELSAAYLSPDLDARADLILDLKATKGMTAKSKLLLSHAFPDADYMRAAYGVSSPIGVAAAYARRLGSAAWRLAL